MNTQAEVLFKSAQSYHAKALLREAEQGYRQALKAAPDHYQAAYHLGIVLHQAGKADDCLKSLEKCLQVKPDYLPALKDQGLILLRKGQNAAALASFRKAVQVSPDTPEFHLNSGIALKNLGRVGEAIACYEAAIRLNPSLPEAYNSLGNALILQGDTERALANFERAIGLRKNYAEAIFNLGTVQFHLGRFEEATRNFAQTLALKPDHADAAYSLCLGLMRQSRLGDAMAVAERALRRNNNDSRFHRARGLVLVEMGKRESAIDAFNRALEFAPDDPELLLLRADTRFALGKHEPALADYERVLALKPESAEAMRGKARCLRKLEKLDDALSAIDAALAIRADYAEALAERGTILRGMRRHEDALSAFDKAIALRPGSAQAHFGRGRALMRLERPADAVAAYDAAIALKPDSPDPYVFRASALSKLEQFEEALSSIDEAITRNPENFSLHLARGKLLLGLRRRAEALKAFRKAYFIRPEIAEEYMDLGSQLFAVKHHRAALKCFDKAVDLKPDLAEAHVRRGACLKQSKRLDEALASYETALSLEPTLESCLSDMWNIARSTCRWDVASRVETEIRRLLNEEKYCVDSFTLLRMFDDPQLQKSVSQARTAYLRRCYTRNVARGPRNSERIRVGYFSSDFFRQHPVSKCIRPVMQNHDLNRFDVYAFTFGHANNSDLDPRIIDRLTAHHDIDSMRSSEVLALTQELKLDIAIDVNGFTGDARMDLFASGLAPIQVGFVGFAGTVGESLLDYIIADPAVIPETSRDNVFEKVVHLPGSFLPYGEFGREHQFKTDRSRYGIREDAFVFCCFNSVDKVSPACFDLWMTVLGAAENSVLWLRSESETANARLRLEAERRGISASRLVFAGYADEGEHVARQGLADLFLDTLPYNAHSTAWDALAAGLPLLTLSGKSFASRVATSTLMSAGLPELVTTTPQDYVDLAIRLAKEPALYTRIRSKLASALKSGPMIDMAGFTRNLESAYERMLERWLNGEAPDHIRITQS